MVGLTARLGWLILELVLGQSWGPYFASNISIVLSNSWQSER